MEEYAVRKIKYFKLMYGEEVKKYEGFKDDRLLFVNIYNIAVEALEAIKICEENTFIKVAMNEALNQDEETLKRIKEKFDKYESWKGEFEND